MRTEYVPTVQKWTFPNPMHKKTRCKSRLIDKNTVNPVWILWRDIIWHHFTFLWSEGCNPAYCLGEFMYNNSRKICSKLINIKHSNQISFRDRFLFKTNSRISSITSYRDHCYSLFTSWVIKQQKKLCFDHFEKNTQFWVYGTNPRYHLNVETWYFLKLLHHE